MPAGRAVEVDPDRLPGWLERFAARHGRPLETAGEDGPPDDVTLALPGARGLEVPLQVRALDGAIARLEPFPFDPVAVALVRRGGYAVGLVVGAAVEASAVGSRYVQSRTAAGGWSQQRYARRRANQADSLVDAAASRLRSLLDARPTPVRALVVGGDRGLVRSMLRHSALAGLDALPRRELFDIPDPNRRVLDAAVRRGLAVRVTVTDPAPGPA